MRPVTNIVMPNLNKYGFLEVGTHTTSLQEIQHRFVDGDLVRQQLWLQFLDLFKNIEAAQAFQAVELFGSFFSSKKTPHDIDLALELKPVDSPISLVVQFFDRDALMHNYHADVLIKEINATPYRPLAPAGYEFATKNLYAFRRLKRPEFADVAKMGRKPPNLAHEYKGVLRVESLTT